MAIDHEIAERFDNVIEKGLRLLTHHSVLRDGSPDRVDGELCLAWQSQGLTLLEEPKFENLLITFLLSKCAYQQVESGAESSRNRRLFHPLEQVVAHGPVTSNAKRSAGILFPG